MTEAAWLVTVPGLPLLLAIPALHRGRRAVVGLALLPAALLLFQPPGLSFDATWMLRGGSGLAFDDSSRGWLATSIVAWTIAVLSLGRACPATDDGRRRVTWLLLALGGQMGALLASDMAGFFASSVAMSYAFYALLVDSGSVAARRAGRTLLVMLVAADLILFEALLLAGHAAQDLRFSSISAAASFFASPASYSAMVIVGFALKAAIWPFHGWLRTTCRAVHPVVVALIWATPVATGLLGIARWLPLGEVAEPLAGTALLGLGLGNLVLALTIGVGRARSRDRVARATAAASGATTVFLGVGLVAPEFWEQFGGLLPYGVALLGFAVTAVAARERRSPPASLVVDGGTTWSERWAAEVLRHGRRWSRETLPRWKRPRRINGYASCSVDRWKDASDRVERVFRRWSTALLLFLSIALLMALNLVFGILG